MSIKCDCGLYTHDCGHHCPKKKKGRYEVGEFTGADLLAHFDAGWKIINTETGQQYTRAELIADLKATGAL